MAAQLALFAAQPLVIAEDAEGGIRYQPDFLEAGLSSAWFEALRTDVEWTQERRYMYERDVDVPRLVAGFALDAPDLPPVLEQARLRLEAAVPARFTHVGLNLYRDGRDSVAPHNDHLGELVTGAPIALLSLGATRRMIIRAKAPPRRALHVDLQAGSLLLMSHASQHHFVHGIPKASDVAGERISVAFRARVAGTP